MAERTDLATLTITKYQEGGPHNASKFFSWINWRYMGVGRRSLDVGRWSIIIELWWVR